MKPKQKNAFKSLSAFMLSCMIICGNIAEQCINVNMTANATENNEEIKYIGFGVSNNGKFTLGTVEGDPNNDSDNNVTLMYGYPEANTSYTTVRIDDIDYMYGSECSSFEISTESNDKTNISTAKYGDIEVTQTIDIIMNPATGRNDLAEIKYEVKNNGSEPHKIGTRIMLDTKLANIDDTPFRVSGIGSVTTETEFTGSEIPAYWQAFDYLVNPTVIAQGNFLRDKSNPPDRVQFANWRKLNIVRWDYQIKEGEKTVDTAVTITWNEKEFKAGMTETYRTYYGLSDFTEDNQPPLAISVYSDALITQESFNKTTNTPEFHSLEITAYIENIGESTAENTYLKLILPEGMSVDANSQNLHTFQTLKRNDMQQISWNVNVSGNIDTGVYPIKVICGADKMEEKSVVRYVNVYYSEDEKDNRILYGDCILGIFWTGQDNFSFTNTEENFLNYEKDPWDILGLTKRKKNNCYHISDEYLHLLTRDMSDKVYLKICYLADSDWNGSCYGMSEVVSLIKSGYLTPYYWQTYAEYTCDLDKPVDNKEIENLINYYQLSQLLPDIVDLKDNSEIMDNNQEALLKQLIKETKKVMIGGLPVVMSFSVKYGNLQSAHTVVAYDVDEGNYMAENGKMYKYRLYICDPNCDKWSYMYVSEGYNDWYYYEMTKLVGDLSKISVDKNGKEMKKVVHVLSDLSTIDIRNPETLEDRTVLKDYNKLFSEKYSASNAIISYPNGSIDFNQVIPISTSSGTSGKGNGGFIERVFLPEDQSVFTVTPDEGFHGIHNSMVLDGYVIFVKADDIESAVFDKSGKVTVNNSKGDYEMELGFDEGKGNLPWFGIKVYGEKTKCSSLEIAEEGMILKSDNMNYIEVCGINRKNRVALKFSTNKDSVHIKAVNDETLGIYIDNDNDGIYETLIADSNGNQYDPPEPENNDPSVSPDVSAPSKPNQSSEHTGSIPENSISEHSEKTGTEINNKSEVFVESSPDQTVKNESSENSGSGNSSKTSESLQNSEEISSQSVSEDFSSVLTGQENIIIIVISVITAALFIITLVYRLSSKRNK